jgi:hypothetical protein
LRNLFFVFILIFPFFCFSQDRKYVFIGLESETIRNYQALNLILDDYNSFHNQYNISTEKIFATPEYLYGINFGYKIHHRFMELGAEFHFISYKTCSEGIDSSYTEYKKNLLIAHNGFTVATRFLFVNTNFFRTGPGIGLKIEQYTARIFDGETMAFFVKSPVSKPLPSLQLHYGISCGGPKFNLDIIAFYNHPLLKINLQKLNETLNYGYHIQYSLNELSLKHETVGISLKIGFGSKENYDF